MSTITGRIRKLELKSGVADTAESRRAREAVETIRGRRLARLNPDAAISDHDDDDYSGMTIADVLRCAGGNGLVSRV